MSPTAQRVAVRYLVANAESDLKKFEQLRRKAEKEGNGLPRLLKTYRNKAHGYRTSDPEKATELKAKILTKVKALHALHASALRLAQTFSASYKPSNSYKAGIYSNDFKPWLTRYAKAVEGLGEDFDSLSILMYGFDGGYVAPGTNPLHDAPNAATSIGMYWDILTRPDLGRVDVPKDGTDEQRFLAFLTPAVRGLAKGVAAKLKKDEKVAGPLIWLLLDNVNADAASRIAERILPGDHVGAEKARKHVIPVSRALNYEPVTVGAFAVALLEEVGSTLAPRLAAALAPEFASDIAA